MAERIYVNGTSYGLDIVPWLNGYFAWALDSNGEVVASGNGPDELSAYSNLRTALGG